MPLFFFSPLLFAILRYFARPEMFAFCAFLSFPAFLGTTNHLLPQCKDVPEGTRIRWISSRGGRERRGGVLGLEKKGGRPVAGIVDPPPLGRESPWPQERLWKRSGSSFHPFGKANMKWAPQGSGWPDLVPGMGFRWAHPSAASFRSYTATERKRTKNE